MNELQEMCTKRCGEGEEGKKEGEGIVDQREEWCENGGVRERQRQTDSYCFLVSFDSGWLTAVCNVPRSLLLFVCPPCMLQEERRHGESLIRSLRVSTVPDQ